MKNKSEEKIARLKAALQNADAVLIGAGAGLSAAAGFEYSGARFEKYFFDFAARYGFTDMYSGGFYPFKSLEKKWAYWSRYIFINRYTNPPKSVYDDLRAIVGDKNYFVITTNVDHCFQRAGFDKSRLFYMQGDYGLFQCGEPCHKKTYGNKDAVVKMLEAQGFVVAENELIVPTDCVGRLGSATGIEKKKAGSVPAESIERNKTGSVPFAESIERNETGSVPFAESIERNETSSISAESLFDTGGGSIPSAATGSAIDTGSTKSSAAKIKMEIPTEQIPRCPVCGKPMSMNLRADGTFVEDAGWNEAAACYSKFIAGLEKASRVLLLELGVGYNTPSIIKYPFWQMTAALAGATYACLNKGEAVCPTEIAERAICIDGDVGEVISAVGVC